MAIYCSRGILHALTLLLSLIYISESFVEKVEVKRKEYLPEQAGKNTPIEEGRNYCDGFLCHDKKCLPEKYVCDGEPDCKSGEDESKCGLNLNFCNDDQFQCNNGDCIERSWACDVVTDCPGGDDEEAALCDNRLCEQNEFKCKSGSCINIEWHCDGQYDCYHSDDEVNCETCTHEQFKCNDDTCIPQEAVCNGYQECVGGEDEHQWCACSSVEYKCNSGVCISHDKVCDGKKDCGYSGEDEHDCKSCDADQFQCSGSGRCIPNSFVCDGLVEDCPNGDDEANCECNVDEFKCSDGTCLLLSRVCDGTVHCSDDESLCECTASEFDCNSETRVCLPANQACDGTPQCPNGFDEEGCPFRCGDDSFVCPDGSCIPASARCNGVYDCGHSSADELECQCADDQFKCFSSECIPSIYVCNSFSDCKDGSDEFTELCLPPEPITGECPNVPAGTIGLCVYECSSDDDCRNEKKCCFNGCGHECVPPIFPPEPFVKEGECPILRPPYGAHTCTDLCLADSDCPHLQKCCSNTCGKVCAEPFTPINEVEEINTNEIEEELQQVKEQLGLLDSRFGWLEKSVSDILVELGILQTEITDLKHHEHYEVPLVHYRPPPPPTTKEPEPPQNVVNGHPTNTGSRPGYPLPSYGQERPSNNQASVGRPTNVHSHRPYKERSEGNNKNSEPYKERSEGNKKNKEFRRMITEWGKQLRSNDSI